MVSHDNDLIASESTNKGGPLASIVGAGNLATQYTQSRAQRHNHVYPKDANFCQTRLLLFLHWVISGSRVFADRQGDGCRADQAEAEEGEVGEAPEVEGAACLLSHASPLCHHRLLTRDFRRQRHINSHLRGRGRVRRCRPAAAVTHVSLVAPCVQSPHRTTPIAHRNVSLAELSECDCGASCFLSCIAVFCADGGASGAAGGGEAEVKADETFRHRGALSRSHAAVGKKIGRSGAGEAEDRGLQGETSAAVSHSALPHTALPLGFSFFRLLPPRLLPSHNWLSLILHD